MHKAAAKCAFLHNVQIQIFRFHRDEQDIGSFVETEIGEETEVVSRVESLSRHPEWR